MAPAWQATPRARQTQPLSYSMQLHPSIDTDAGSIAAADGEGSFTQTHMQRLVPSAEAAQSSRQACCSVDETSSDRHSSHNQLHDGEDGVQCRQMYQSDREMGQFDRLTVQHEGQSRFTGGPSHRQHGAANRSEPGGDATDQCSAYDSAGLNSPSVGLSHSSRGSGSARPDGKSPFARMQEMQYGQAESALSPLKVCFRVPAMHRPPVKTVQWHTCCSLPVQHQAKLCLCTCRCMRREVLSAVWQCSAAAAPFHAAAAAGPSPADGLANLHVWGLLGVSFVSGHLQALMHCNNATQVGAVSSAGHSAMGYPARLALQRISNVSTVYRNHASPRSMSRQSVFLGQPAALQPEGWNASIKPQSPRQCPGPMPSGPGRPTTAGSNGTAVSASPVGTPRHAAVVCKAIGISKPKVPLLSLAALQAERHHLSMQTPHRKVLASITPAALHCTALHYIALRCIASLRDFSTSCSHT